LERRTPLRAKHKSSGIDLDAAGRWHAAVTRAPCLLCGATSHIEGHHVIKQQALRRRAQELGLDPNLLLWDRRIGVALCHDCHANVTAAMLHIPLGRLPARVFEFCSDFELHWLLERDVGRRAA
jgi:hypothetical protein